MANTTKNLKMFKILSRNLANISSSSVCFQSKLRQSSQRLVVKRAFSIKSVCYSAEDTEAPSEEVYWDAVKSSVENDATHQSDMRNVDKRTFVLQLKMQYKGKWRQSTTPELQLSESIALVQTLAHFKVVDSLVVGTKNTESRELFGAGNQETLSKRIAKSGANCLFVVIDKLTSMQVRTLRRSLLGNSDHIQIYDRYKIVLEIFKQNARSSIAKLQIALAEIPYMRHKYQNDELYKSVERKIKKELESKTRTRGLLNAERHDKKLPLVSVFGYTNVGKTSFIKLITDDDKMNPENKLFATLDVTYHGTNILNSNQRMIFADTIGFISDIPYNLIEAFKSTLHDTINADLYIHLIDMSHPDREAQENTVNKILNELAPQEKVKSMIRVYNKCDLVSDYKSLTQTQDENTFFISCANKSGVDQLRQVIEKRLLKKLAYIQLKLRVSQGSPEWFYLNKNAVIQEMSQDESDSQFVRVRVIMSKLNAIKMIKEFPLIEVSK